MIMVLAVNVYALSVLKSSAWVDDCVHVFLFLFLFMVVVCHMWLFVKAPQKHYHYYYYATPFSFLLYLTPISLSPARSYALHINAITNMVAENVCCFTHNITTLNGFVYTGKWVGHLFCFIVKLEYLIASKKANFNFSEYSTQNNTSNADYDDDNDNDKKPRSRSEWTNKRRRKKHDDPNEKHMFKMNELILFGLRNAL